MRKSRPKDGKLESTIRAEVRTWLEEHCIFPAHRAGILPPETHVLGTYWMPVQTGYGLTGISDFLIVFGGRLIAAEAKAQHVTPVGTSNQQRFQRSIARAGGAAFVFNSLTSFIAHWVTEVDPDHYLKYPQERPK